MGTEWTQLPTNVLEEVLKGVGLCNRMCHCALACCKWQEAAEATITAIADAHGKQQAVLHWIRRRGPQLQLQQLSLTGGHGIVLSALPCPSLKQLQLSHGFKLLLAPGAGHPGILHGIRQLTRLVLLRVTLLGGPQQLTALSTLTGLQHLVLRELQDSSLQYAAVPGCLLPHLPQLTHLHMVCGLSDATLQLLSCLTRLQQLQLERLGACTTPAALAGISDLMLTDLLLEGAHFTLGDASTPGLARLASLRVLQLHACNGLQPSLLSALTGLHDLQLQLTPIEGAGEGAGTFLSLLSRLRQLTALLRHGALVHEAPSSHAYASLLASSKLQRLQLSNARLPGGAWQALFPTVVERAAAPARKLTSLCICYCEEHISGMALQGLTRCCPALQTLHLHGPLQQRSTLPAATPHPLSALQLLAQLTELSLSDVNDAAAAALSRLTSLSSLMVIQPSSISDVGVLRLAALQQLTYLWVASEGLSRALVSAGSAGNLLHLVSLLLPCADSGVCQPGEPHTQQMTRLLCCRPTGGAAGGAGRCEQQGLGAAVSALSGE